MKAKIFATTIAVFILVATCFSQPQGGGMKPPGIEERLKMVNEKICQPLKLDTTQINTVTSAFKEFFTEMDKLMGNNSGLQTRPEKSKVEALAKILDDKVKSVIPENLFSKYLELEKLVLSQAR